jgi:hypothetical protein
LCPEHHSKQTDYCGSDGNIKEKSSISHGNLLGPRAMTIDRLLGGQGISDALPI